MRWCCRVNGRASRSETVVVGKSYLQNCPLRKVQTDGIVRSSAWLLSDVPQMISGWERHVCNPFCKELCASGLYAFSACFFKRAGLDFQKGRFCEMKRTLRFDKRTGFDKWCREVGFFPCRKCLSIRLAVWWEYWKVCSRNVNHFSYLCNGKSVKTNGLLFLLWHIADPSGWDNFENNEKRNA